MDTIENNKLIAEFMGIPSYKHGNYKVFEFAENNCRTDVDLHYHKSWDWLMPVVEKVFEQLRLTEYRFESERINELKLYMQTNDISGVNRIVVLFIKHYNENK